MSSYYGYRKYVRVADRRARAARKMAARAKKGLDVQPIEPFRGRGIARTFWGSAWCDHLESFSDYENRLPRGRTYVRNGSVCHLEILEGEVRAMVMGNSLYHVKVAIKKLPVKKWRTVKQRCAGEIGSLIELLEGRLSDAAMAVVTDRDEGLFPRPREIRLGCDCPDWATMCKHVAAVLYGVGVRLDDRPELLFLLRGVDHEDLITSEARALAAATGGDEGGRRRLDEGDLEDIFGIEVAEEAPAEAEPRPVTGNDVADLRLYLDLSRREFARLLGVSVATVGNWERNLGPLRLQARTAAAWERASGLDREEARRRARGSAG